MSGNENSKSGCCGIIAILIVLGLIVEGINIYNRSIRKHHDISFKTRSVFHRTDDKAKLTLEFWGKDYGSMYYIYDADGNEFSSIPPMYFKIKHGDELYDREGTYFGYIKVLKDGSFNIKNGDIFNGHFVSISGDKASIIQYNDEINVKKKKHKKDYLNVYEDLLGEWYYPVVTSDSESLVYMKITKKKKHLIYEFRKASWSSDDGIKYDESFGDIKYNKNKRRIELNGYWDSCFIYTVENNEFLIRKDTHSKDTRYLQKDPGGSYSSVINVPIVVSTMSSSEILNKYKFNHINEVIKEHDMVSDNY